MQLINGSYYFFLYYFEIYFFLKLFEKRIEFFSKMSLGYILKFDFERGYGFSFYYTLNGF